MNVSFSSYFLFNVIAFDTVSTTWSLTLTVFPDRIRQGSQFQRHGKLVQLLALSVKLRFTSD